MKDFCECGGLLPCPECDGDELTASLVDPGVMCECLKTMAGYYPDSWGKHHHKECPKYKTEKFPYLLYYEEAINAWTFAPDRVENVVDLEDGDDIEIQFKCKSFTDAEVDAVPED